VSRIEIDLTDRGSLTRLGALDLDLIELRPGLRASALGWPGAVGLLREAGLSYRVVDPDFGAALAERSQRDRHLAATPFERGALPEWGGPPPGEGSVGGFRSYAEVTALMRAVAEDESLGKTVVLDTLGFSLGARPILALGLVDRSRPAGSRPEVLFTALTHAREPEGMETILYFMLRLLRDRESDPLAAYLVENREIWFVPVVNPDGYVLNERTWRATGSFGFWRKNLRDNDDDDVLALDDGVDLNRNFGYRWGFDDDGSSPVPSSQTYRGKGPFSEPETAALRDFCAAHRFVTANNYHAYYGAVVYPWSHVAAAPPDAALYIDLADRMTDRSGYAYGYGDQVLYPVNGDSDDWMYGERTVKPRILSVTTEVGRLDDGFWPVPSRILPLAQRNYETNLVLAYAAGVYLVAGRPEIIDRSGFLRPGETARMRIPLTHAGITGTTSGGVRAVLTSLDPNLTIPDSVACFGDLGPGETRFPEVDDWFRLRLSPRAVPGSEVSMRIDIRDGDRYVGRDSLRLRVGEPVRVFSDDGSAGLGNWIASGGWGSETVDGDPVFSDSPEGFYASGTEGRLTAAAALDLRGADRAVLGFTARWDIESGFDFGLVEASEDGGATWCPLAGNHTVAGHGETGAYRGGVQPLGVPGYEGSRRRWTEETVDLSAYAGCPNLRLRFRLVADCGGNRDGWMIDDVHVDVYGPISTAEGNRQRSRHPAGRRRDRAAEGR